MELVFSKSKKSHSTGVNGQKMKKNIVGRTYRNFDDEFDTRYLDPKPYVNVVKVDQDLKSLVNTLTKSKLNTTHRVSETIMSNLNEIERENKKEIRSKQKYDEWK